MNETKTAVEAMLADYDTMAHTWEEFLEIIKVVRQPGSRFYNGAVAEEVLLGLMFWLLMKMIYWVVDDFENAPAWMG
ncbi:hypothetical protein BT63DRAFT_476371 [Microthyrium microscopicum]|uniref:Uncharacterized protein n=1 Tax=Microthyrium microscopicum TaxID=703497 RepID=A0A6A6UNQ7_9PEZI|nr:hypothetical protein BT63DRAFT_476371 [Microthyrium microscopicum]